MKSGDFLGVNGLPRVIPGGPPWEPTGYGYFRGPHDDYAGRYAYGAAIASSKSFYKLCAAPSSVDILGIVPPATDLINTHSEGGSCGFRAMERLEINFLLSSLRWLRCGGGT